MGSKMEMREKIDETLSSQIAAVSVPGAVFQAYARDGSNIYSGVTGKRSQTSEQPMTEDTVFWLASATKVLTAMCALKCVDQGLIKLDDDVVPQLPDLAMQQVREGFMTPEFKLVPRTSGVTLRQLLSMTAGTSYPQVEALMAQFAIVPAGTEPFMVADKAGYVGPLDHQPGNRWAYSGAMDWAGAVVEKLSGLKLGEYLNRHILEPCGVADQITFELTPAMRDRLAGAHFRWPDGRVTPRGKIYSDDVKEHLGGIGSYGTAQAYSQLLLPLVNEGRHPITGKQILSAAIVKEMLTGQLDDDQRKWLDLPTVAVNMQVMLPGVEKQWGLGCLLYPNGTASGRGEGSGSWAGFANTHWMVDPKKGVVSVMFAQLIPQEDPKLIEVRDACERIMYDSL